MLTAVDKGLPGRLSFHHSTNTGQEHHQDKIWIKKIHNKYSSIDQITHLKKHLTDAIGGTNASLQYVVFRELKKYEAQRLAEERRKQQTRPAPRFVLIIDEINRGNVANIFGELITLLEEDKRAGRPEALTVQLPYSKEDFTVPENLYLLGTMNTADRSVEALDTALRRRFSFTEMRPSADVIRQQAHQGVIGAGAQAVDVARLLEVLNSRLEQLLDHDHCLGHALLLRLTDLDGLRAAFARNILPLLQEYFFGDWGKIGLVLGPRFVEVVPATAPGRFALASLPGYDGGPERARPLYRLTPPTSWDAAAFQSIYPAAPAPAV
jgi:5-methylcytosine-specific restriction protein B